MTTASPIRPTTRPQAFSAQAARIIGELVPLLTRTGSVEEKFEIVAQAMSDKSAYKTVDFMVLEGDDLNYLRHHQFSLIDDKVAQSWEEGVQTRDSLSTFKLFETSREPVNYPYIRIDPRINETERSLAILAGLGSVLVVPLIWDETIGGALAVSGAYSNAFDGSDAVLLMSIATEVGAILHQQRLIEDLQLTRDRMAKMQSDTVLMLVQTAEAYDDTTGIHLLNVRLITECIARELGFSPAESEHISEASVLHDLGKVRIDRDILVKPRPLTVSERERMQLHTVWGESLLAGREGFDLAARVARWHHERWDGAGYPDRLKADEIPLDVAIVTVADSFDAIVRSRPYKPSFRPEWAIAEILLGAGTQFNPQVAEALACAEARGVFEDSSLAC